MSTLLFMLSCLACLQLALLYPTDGTDQLIQNYRMRLAKKDPSYALKDSLLSALLMSEMPRDSQSQRKKAVDSTFIRFGRSSWSEESGRRHHAPPPSPSTGQASEDFDYYVDNNRVDANLNRKLAKTSKIPEALKSEDLSKRTPSFPSGFGVKQTGCLVENNGDFVRALMGKTCVRVVPKVKRENVNDTFIRFGKRNAPDRLDSDVIADVGSDEQIKYGR